MARCREAEAICERGSRVAEGQGLTAEAGQSIPEVSPYLPLLRMGYFHQAHRDARSEVADSVELPVRSPPREADVGGHPCKGVREGVRGACLS